MFGQCMFYNRFSFVTKMYFCNIAYCDTCIFWHRFWFWFCMWDNKVTLNVQTFSKTALCLFGVLQKIDLQLFLDIVALHKHTHTHACTHTHTHACMQTRTHTHAHKTYSRTVIIFTTLLNSVNHCDWLRVQLHIPVQCVYVWETRRHAIMCV